MNTDRPFVRGLIVAVFLAAAAPVSAAPIGDATVDYVADLTIASSDATLSGTIHHRAGRNGGPGIDRVELESGRGPMTIIVRPDKKTAWMLLTERRAYAAYNLRNARAMVGVMDDRLVDLTYEKDEIIAGITTRRYAYQGKDRRGNQIGGKVWLTESQIVMKMNGYEQSPRRRREITVELQNIQFKTPPSQLFDLPRGWKEIRLR
jgi:hypothetical protein